MKKNIFNIIGIALSLILSINFVHAQMECNNQPPEQMTTADDYHEGSLYVKLYLFILKKQDGTGGWPESKIIEVVEGLEEIYGAHDIHFNICISELNNQYYYDNPSELDEDALETLGINYQDGIKGFLSDGTNSGGGSAPVPGKIFNVGGIWSGTVYHEIGHCLGLYHTFQDGGSEYAPYYENGILQYGANSGDTGDLVFDTPADMTVFNIGVFFNTSTCEFLNPAEIRDNSHIGNSSQDEGHIYIDPEGYLVHNLMTYYNGSCRNLITPGQAERIRHEITEIPEVIEDYHEVLPVFNKDYYILGNTTWENYNRIINGNIYINNGNFHIDNSNIQFTEGHKVVVKASNNPTLLNITNSLLNINFSNTCYPANENATWGGIEIDMSLPGYTMAPYVMIGGTTISNAGKAISNISYNIDNNFWLSIDESEFINNKMGIDIIHSDGPIWIRNSNFEYNRTDDSSLKPQLQFVHAKTPFIFNTNIKNLNHALLESNSEGFYGIGLYDSDIFISGLNSVEKPEISYWNKGINRYDGPGRGFRISNMKIDENVSGGIYCKRSYSLMNIRKNDISNSWTSGIKAEDDRYTDFQISYNNIHDNNLGISINTKQKNDNCFLYNNNFTNVQSGGILWRNSNNIDESGTLFECNILDGDGQQYVYQDIGTYGNINPIQAGMNGYGDITSIGNKYNHSFTNTDFSANLGGGVKAKYYWETLSEKPEIYFGIIPIYNNEPANCGEDYFGDDDDDDLGDGDTGEEDDKWEIEKEIKDTLIETITTKSDGGNTDDVLEIIENVTIETAEAVTQGLVNIGPWLSEPAALSMIQNIDIFTASQVVRVLSANPDLFVYSTIYQFAFGANSPLSTNNQDLLRAVLGSTTERTTLSVKLSRVNLRINHIINKAIEKTIFNNEGITDYNNLRLWLDRKDTYKSKIDIAETYAIQGDFSGAISYLQTLLLSPKISNNEINDINKYIEVMQILDIAYKNQRYEATMTSAEISTIENIAHSNTDLAQSKARGILEYFYGYTFEGDKEPNPMIMSYKTPLSSVNNSNIDIYPNPNNGLFEIRLGNNSDDITIQNVKILTIDGKVIMEKKYNVDIKQVKLHLENTVQGVYMYNILDSKGKLHTGKLIIK